MQQVEERRRANVIAAHGRQRHGPTCGSLIFTLPPAADILSLMAELVPITVRPAGRRNGPFLADCQVRMAAETESLALDPPTVALGVAGVFDDPHRGRYFIAEIDGRPAGCLLTVPEWSDWRNGTVLWIHSVYVHPEHRRRGLFSALYAHLRHTWSKPPPA